MYWILNAFTHRSSSSKSILFLSIHFIQHPPYSSFRFSFRLCDYHYSLLTLKCSIHSILFIFILYSRFSFLTFASLRLRSLVHLTVVFKLIYVYVSMNIYFIFWILILNKNQEKSKMKHKNSISPLLRSQSMLILYRKYLTIEMLTIIESKVENHWTAHPQSS